MVDPATWLDPVTVQGRVVNPETEEGFEGLIWFVPDEPFIRYGGQDYAIIAGAQELVEGTFKVLLTRCDIPGQTFTYDVYIGGNHWKARVCPSEDGSPVELQEVVTRAEQ